MSRKIDIPEYVSRKIDIPEYVSRKIDIPEYSEVRKLGFAMPATSHVG